MRKVELDEALSRVAMNVSNTEVRELLLKIKIYINYDDNANFLVHVTRRLCRIPCANYQDKVHMKDS